MAKASSTKTVNGAKRKLSVASKRADLCMCTACAREFDTPRGNFYRSKSTLYEGNDAYITICKECVDRLYTKLTQFYNGDEKRTMERLCIIFDMYYSDQVYAMTENSAPDRSRVSNYISKLNLAAGRGNRTYNDTVIENQTREADAEDAANSTQEIRVTQRDTELFGFGWKPEEYKQMRTVYRDLRGGRTLLPHEEILLQDLCITRIKMANLEDAAKYAQMNKLFRDIYADFMSRFEKEEAVSQNVALDPIGKIINMIEDYTPAEYYKDKKLFADYDGIGEYFSRYILRPLKNLMHGTREMDSEFSVSGGEDE